MHWEALTVNTKAAARAVARPANSLEGVPPRLKTSPNPSNRRGCAELDEKGGGGRGGEPWAGVLAQGQKALALKP